jgi:UDP-2,4-diacetamido-2,4,6-trideoxy-beta-L-altropyranose hydrolase
MKNIIIRCDSSYEIGTGHLMRTLVLANQIKKHFNIIYVTKELSGNRNNLIYENSFLHVRLENSLQSIADKFEPSLIIVDDYSFSYEEEKELSKKYDVLIFDDEYKKHCAKYVLNYSIVAYDEEYKDLVPKKTNLLCGSRYTLFKKEFLQKKYEQKKIKKILIAMGGSDALNISKMIAISLHVKNKNLDIGIVTTKANKNLKNLKDSRFSLHVNISDMASLIKSYDLIVTCASTSMLECIALKKPFIAIECANNQSFIASALSHYGFILKEFNKARFNRIFDKIESLHVKHKRLFLKYKFERAKLADMIVERYF